METRTTRPPLIVITSNDERDLPRAFLRRCVVLTLEPPNAEQLIEMAKLHFDTGLVDAMHLKIYERLANLITAMKQEEPSSRPVGPSTAEYLDAVRACRDLSVNADADEELWNILTEVTLRKPRESRGA